MHCEGFGVPYSKLVTLSPLITNILDMCCIIVFIIIRLYRSRWAREHKKDKKINIIMAIFFGLILVDNTLSITIESTPYFTQLVRPFIVGCFMISVRTSLVVMGKDLWNSITVLICIMTYVGVFSHIGHLLFR